MLRRPQPDVILVEPPPTTGAVTRIVCTITGTPYVYRAADLWSVAATHTTRSRLVLALLHLVENWSLAGAHSAITVSDEVKTRLLQRGIETPVEITGVGADTESFHYELASTAPLFIYAGTYSHLHGTNVLIDAFALFKEDHPRFKLCFVGTGTEQEELERQASHLGVNDSIEFCSPVSASTLNKMLSRATASLATLAPHGGYDFAFATKTLSSLASGCPVIFSGPGPTGDFLRMANDQVPAGIVIPYDSVSIAEAMSAVANRPWSPTQRKRLADWTRHNASLHKVAERATQVIEVAGRSRKKRR